MESFSIILGLSNISIAGLMVGASIPLVMGKIPMNKRYGIRFKKSFESKENWYKINTFGGRQLIIWSTPLFLIGMITFFLSTKENTILSTLIACAPLMK